MVRISKHFSERMLAACKSGDVKGIQEVLKDEPRFDMNRKLLAVKTPLFIAASCGNVEAVEFILSIPEINVNETSKVQRETPLYAVCCISKIKILQILCEHLECKSFKQCNTFNYFL
eukprot:c34113_g1_i1.p1 GENE.c34113_g1_i1~~c34113_g1_i1.p1  ORF type:complete len:117 (+),score=32.65 c34113_g1_i1:19-369(+)